MACLREYIPQNGSFLPPEYRHERFHEEYNLSRTRVTSDGTIVSHVKVLEHYNKRPNFLRHSGMCFMLRQCNYLEQITCHRFKAVFKVHRGIVADKIYRHRSYYRTASSCEIMEIGGSMTPVGWCS